MARVPGGHVTPRFWCTAGRAGTCSRTGAGALSREDFQWFKKKKKIQSVLKSGAELLSLAKALQARRLNARVVYSVTGNHRSEFT